MKIQRRDFLRMSTGAVVATVAGASGLLSWAPRAQAQTIAVSLTAMKGNVTQIDGVATFMFSFSNTGVVTVPGPTIICQAGDTILLTLSNTLNTPVVIAVPGTSIKLTAPANGSAQISFAAPAPGSYLYCDTQNGGVNRIMGLHGSLVVMPAGIKNQAFTGGPTFKRQFKWLLGNVDPTWCSAVQTNGDSYVASIVPSTFQPRYFTVNGSSYDKTAEPNSSLFGLFNDAALVRLMNAGGMVHSPHFHGNHVEICSINRQNFSSNRKQKDVCSMYPLDCRDVIYPFKVPPDAWPAVTNQPQNFPMHCHSEMSQTAGGGMYPHGMHCMITQGVAPATESDLTLGVAQLP